MKLSPTTTLLVLTVGLAACTGTDVGNPQTGTANVELNFTGYDTTQQRNALTLSNGYEIESAWVGLQGFGAKQASNCDANTEVDSDETVVLDLIGHTSDYAAPRFQKTAGDFCRFDLTFHKLGASELPAAAPADLADHSVVVRGRRDDGVEFVVHSDLADSVPLHSPSTTFHLDAGDDYLLVGFALDEWFDAGQIAAITGEDPIVIDADHHPDLLTNFETAIKTSATLFKDLDGDGNLDANEFTEVLADGDHDDAQDVHTSRDAGLVNDQTGDWDAGADGSDASSGDEVDAGNDGHADAGESDAGN